MNEHRLLRTITEREIKIRERHMALIKMRDKCDVEDPLNYAEEELGFLKELLEFFKIL